MAAFLVNNSWIQWLQKNSSTGLWVASSSIRWLFVISYTLQVCFVCSYHYEGIWFNKYFYSNSNMFYLLNVLCWSVSVRLSCWFVVNIFSLTSGFYPYWFQVSCGLFSHWRKKCISINLASMHGHTWFLLWCLRSLHSL